jgi:hypothetical protein
MSDQTPPRENLIRAVMPAVEYRDDPAEGDTGPVLFGHFARFNEWTEIRSAWEGNFMERFVPRAFTKTLRERGNSLKVLFQHGQDPEVGDKPIASINDVREDEEGAFYEARLFDGLPPLIMEGCVPASTARASASALSARRSTTARSRRSRTRRGCRSAR